MSLLWRRLLEARLDIYAQINGPLTFPALPLDFLGLEMPRMTNVRVMLGRSNG